MKIIKNPSKLLLLLCKIFFIGLLFQFFAHTFFTFIVGRTGTIAEGFWLRKEIFVIVGVLYATYIIIKTKAWQSKNIMRYMTIAYIVLFGYLLIDTILFKGLSLGWFIKAWKYDLIGYMIFIAIYYIALYHQDINWKSVVKRSLKVMKTLLVVALIWYCILLLKPGTLKLFGYSRLTVEGEIGQRPPAVYWTREFEGFPRNQFLFERPISRGFYLIAMFPLFFVQYLQRKSFKKTWFWRVVYALNVIVTYSRAARGSWVIELAILGFVTYRKQMAFFTKKILIPMLIILVGVAYVARDQVIHRQFSNTGHIQLLKQGLDYFGNNWLLGMGAGSVGPASHWEGGLNFNPENQYLQIAIEFGIIGFVLWMIRYVRLHLIGLQALRKVRNTKDCPQEIRYLIAFSIGMVGLSVSGLVLHSFTDRMIVYPYMMLGGIIFYVYVQETTKQNTHIGYRPIVKTIKGKK